MTHHATAGTIPPNRLRPPQPELLAMILEAKFGQHLPLNLQSET